MNFKTISVIGLGYIGLPTAAMFASKGKKVIGVDVRHDIVKNVNKGKIHIVEPELDEIVSSAVNNGFLEASLSIKPSDVFLIAVPTPFLKDKSSKLSPEPDLSFIRAAINSIAKVLKKGDLVILESTSPVGATEKIASWLEKKRPDLTFPQTYGNSSDIRLAYCPERVLPGQVVKELVQNDRIIGGITNKCSQAAIDLYKIFVEGACITTNARTAELAKLTENSSRDVNIAFANELSMICDELDIDVWELINLANRHPRVNILQPGPGVGGHCIAVDPWFIVSSSPNRAKLIEMARIVNDSKPNWVIEKVKIAVADFLKFNPDRSFNDIVITCFGLSFKPDIDDLRESPSMQIAMKLAEFSEQKVLAVEPNISSLPCDCNIELVTFEHAEANSDIAVLLVDHADFKLSNIPNIKVIIDTKGIWKKPNKKI